MDPVKARCFHTERLIMRGYDELVGLCKGIIADVFYHKLIITGK